MTMKVTMEEAGLMLDAIAEGRASTPIEVAAPMFRIAFLGWGTEGSDLGTHLDGYNVADYGIALDARYDSHDEAKAAMAECTGADCDGIEPMLTVVEVPCGGAMSNGLKKTVATQFLDGGATCLLTVFEGDSVETIVVGEATCYPGLRRVAWPNAVVASLKNPYDVGLSAILTDGTLEEFRALDIEPNRYKTGDYAHQVYMGARLHREIIDTALWCEWMAAATWL